MRVACSPLVLLVLLVAAGCLDAPAPGDAPPGDEGADPTPGVTSPPPEEEPATPVPFRTLATGWQSELHHPVRLVFTDPEEWASFWREHEKETLGGNGEPEPASSPPDVDFSRERAVAVTLGDKPNSCWSVRITDATASAGVTTLTVTTYEPGPAQACLLVVTQPYAMVAIPADGTEVAYRDETVAGAPPAPLGP